MGDGRWQTVALHTVASPAPHGVLHFVSANEAAKKKNKVQEVASNKASATAAGRTSAIERLAEEDP
jgi:hypothetical protein